MSNAETCTFEQVVLALEEAEGIEVADATQN